MKPSKVLLVVLYLSVFVFCFFVSRLAILYYSTQTFFGPDEQLIGTLSLHIDRGLLVPTVKYQMEDHQGGSVVTGLAAYPFFHFLGPSYFSLKLSSFVFSLILFIVLFFLILKYFGLTGSVFFGVIFIFAPFYYLQQSLVAYGNHMEVSTFYALVLFCLFGASLSESSELTKGESVRKILMLVLAAAFHGFGVYFDHLALVLVPVVLLFLFLASRSLPQFALAFLIYAVGFRAGLSPWYAFHKDGNFLSYIGHFMFHANPDSGGETSYNNPILFIRAVTVNVLDFYESRDLPIGDRILSGRLLNGSVFSVFVGAYFYELIRSRRAIKEFLSRAFSLRRTRLEISGEHVVFAALIAVPLHLIAYALFMDQSPEALPPHRYLLPVFVFHFLLIAAALGHLWQEKRRRVGLAGLALVLMAGVGGFVGIFQNAEPGASLKTPGYSHQYFSGSMQFQYQFDIDEMALVRLAKERFPGVEDDYYTGLFAGIAALHGVSVQGHWNAILKSGPASERAFISGLGSASAVLNLDQNSPPAALAPFIEADLLDDYFKGMTYTASFHPETEGKAATIAKP